MPLTVGTRLAHYDITALIGEGGMGQVYQARDTKLGRQVALKILPEAFAADPDRLARFQREAQVLASLNHPGIAAIYGLEEAEDIRALVLELVEGPTLEDRISEGPIPLDEALPIAKQIAEALEAAHEAGVIHRDLKPANIKVRDDGTVKVLDFGLAKALDPSPAGDPSQSPTLTAAATQMGVIMGTAAYMSPEQAAGETTDKRSDIWSFGVVLFEMLTGRRVFEGKTVSHVLSAVLQVEPKWEALPTTTPQPLTRLMRRCLEKEQKRRLRDIGEALVHLEEAATAPPVVPVTQPAGWQRALPWVAGIAIGGLAVGVTVWGALRSVPRTSGSLARFAITDPLTIANDNRDFALSRDGTFVAYFAGIDTARQLYVRRIAELEATAVRAADRFFDPFISPDGAWIGFIDDTERALTKISVRGGPPVQICELQSDTRGATWGSDGTIIFATAASNGGLFRVSALGGAPTAVTTPDSEAGEIGHRWPQLLPGENAVLFTIFDESLTPERAKIAVLNLETGTRQILVQGGSNAQYSPTGHLVYGAEGRLWAVPFDLASHEVTGAAEPVLDGVVTKPSGAVNFGLSEDGSLVYVTGAADGGVQRTLAWVDRQGREEPLSAPPRPYQGSRISPDGTQVAFDLYDQDNDIWIWSIAGETMTRLTFSPDNDVAPEWTSDGRGILFGSAREGLPQVFRKEADGTGTVERLSDSSKGMLPRVASADGRYVVLGSRSVDTGRDLYVMDLEGERSIDELLHAEFDERNPSLSPDSRWLAYQSNESDRDEIYVRPFPDVDGDRWQVSTEGGRHPVWSRDGSELFYHSDGQMTAVPVQTESTFSFGRPESLFGGSYRFGIAGRTYDVAPDSQRFLMIKPVASASSAAALKLAVVLNWSEELKRLVPVD